MLNKLKQLLSLSRAKYISETDHDGLPKLSVRIPMRTVKPCKSDTQQEEILHKDISEPVLSFLKVFEENPKRFKVSENKDCYITIYKLHDKLTGENFKVIYSTSTFKPLLSSDYVKAPSTEWCTDYELDLIISTLKSYYSARKEKLDAIKAKRKAKRNITELQRLCKIYGGSL